MSPRLVALLLLALCLASAPASAQPQPASCDVALDPQLARTLFQLVRTPTADGCRLDTLRTERFSAEVRLLRGDAPVPSLRLAASACLPRASERGATLSIDVPAAAREACPVAVPRAIAAVRAFDFDRADPEGYGTRSEARRSRGFLVALLLCALVAALTLSLRRAEQDPPA